MDEKKQNNPSTTGDLKRNKRREKNGNIQTNYAYCLKRERSIVGEGGVGWRYPQVRGNFNENKESEKGGGVFSIP